MEYTSTGEYTFNVTLFNNSEYTLNDNWKLHCEWANMHNIEEEHQLRDAGVKALN
jgi:hypothetical protein